VFLLAAEVSDTISNVWMTFDPQAGSPANHTYHGLSIPLVLFPTYQDDIVDYLWHLLQGSSSTEGSVKGSMFCVVEDYPLWELEYEALFGEDQAAVPEPEPEPAAPPVFLCGICLEDEDPGTAVRLDCGHQFCVDSLHGFISSRVEEGLLPIPCASCLAGQSDAPTHMTLELGRRINLPEPVAERWERLEVEAFGVLITCRRCEGSGMIDREEYLAVDQISCPFGDCINRWCRHCDQQVVYGRQHTCDGSAELARAMEEYGWMACPGGCGTRIERTVGCNHMTCPAPGCFAHFCYRDGQLIIRSQDRTAVQEAIRTHYANCLQFDSTLNRPQVAPAVNPPQANRTLNRRQSDPTLNRQRADQTATRRTLWGRPRERQPR